ncbi:MAG TPA: SEC-C metal-binding domain-containing protein [Rubrivivax sp.]|nr:SEC-C metal-binding domain-containing protein [Rubrivivax sp.]
MTEKVGRNEPCPCGSGKKYKNCCGRAAVQELQSAKAHDEAVPRAMAWLAQHHRKAFAAALQQEIEEAVFACFDDDEQAANDALAGIGDELWGQMEINFNEWLLAEGDIQVKGVSQRVSELLLGPAGPLLEVGQRAWLEQLAQRPLRLYDITEVLPGSGLTLCDALDTTQPPINVIERGASRSLRVGMQIGARVMALNGTHVLSGAIYPFTLFGGRAAQESLRALAAHPCAHEEDDALAFGLRLIEGWLVQFLRPGPLPSFVHAASGEPLLFTTDHYEVLDWAALGAALTAQPDVKGGREAGWDRLIDSDDGLTRSQATVAPQPGGKRVSLLYKTATLAEQGRPWFEALAGTSVKYLLREVSDPKGMLSTAGASAARPGSSMQLPEGLDPQELAHALASVVRSTYANWADEPIPALGGQTPRQAMADPTGLERVKGLLRSYEDGEAQMAAKQGRSRVSYQFLWDALGLAR